MKVYISADIEGVLGTTRWDETMPGSYQYIEMVNQMELEVSAACEGLKKAGVTEVYVKDAHGTGCNLRMSKLPDDIHLIKGWTNTPLDMVGALNDEFDAVVLIGYHDMAGGNGNPLAHTTNSRKIRSVRINNNQIGELYIQSMTAAYYNVPIIFVSGDEATCHQASELLGDITAVVTKSGLGSGTINRPRGNVIRSIEQGVKDAVSCINRMNCVRLPEVFKVEVTYNHHFDALHISHYPEASLIKPATVGFEHSDYYEIIRFLHFAL